MAKKAKMDTGKPESSGIHPGDFQRDINEIVRQKGHASEYNGAAGKLTRDALTRHHLDRAAFTFTMRLKGMDEQKRQSAILGALQQIEAAGFFDQVDAFNDLVEVLEGMVQRMKARQPAERKVDPAITALMN